MTQEDEDVEDNKSFQHVAGEVAGTIFDPGIFC